MFKGKRFMYVSAATLVLLLAGASLASALTLKQTLGMFIFMDTNLSNPKGQSCMTCHDPSAAFVDPTNVADPANKVVSDGAVAGKVGGRNSPSAAYSLFSPVFHWDDAEGLYFGGQFLDGRAPTLKEQAKGPFLNPLEMNNTKKGVINTIKKSSYKFLFLRVFGPTSLDNVETTYDKMAEAIADFETTVAFNRFSSKYDYYLKQKAKLSLKEYRGFLLFNDPLKGNCAACHPSTPDPAIDPNHAVFTDFSYDNLGLPKSENPLIANNLIDFGLGARQEVIDEKSAMDPTDPIDVDRGDGVLVTVSQSEAGKFKVMPLRNIADTAPYGHNGYFATLKEIVHFYNTRDVLGDCAQTPNPVPGQNCWPKPEVELNVNTSELGNLGLTDAEEDAIVAFLQTLSDGYRRR